MTEYEYTPEERAEAAARDLADRGQPVTSRAVRDLASVRMTVAAEAARAWNTATSEQAEIEVPDVPIDVRGRLDAIWADSYRAAHAAVSPERDRLAATVEELRGEVDALTKVVAEVETERDARSAEVESAREMAGSAEARARECEAKVQGAEARASAAEGERDRLAAQVTALIQRLPDPEPKPG